jgi:hypothetical protein
LVNLVSDQLDAHGTTVAGNGSSANETVSTITLKLSVIGHAIALIIGWLSAYRTQKCLLGEKVP